MTKPYIEVTPEILQKVEEFASRGLTKEQIAPLVGMSETTFFERQREYPSLPEAYKRGKAKGIGTIANALFENALAGNTTSQIFYLKCRAQWREEDPDEKQKDDSLDKAKALIESLKGENGHPPTASS